MKALAAILLLALAAGCTTVVTPQGEKYGYFLNSNWGIVNNTPYRLTVFQDGVEICQLHPGQVVTLPPKVCRQSLVSVSAYDLKCGNYVGSATHTFDYAFNWQVNRVNEVGDPSYRQW